MVEPSRLATMVGLYSIPELEARGVDRSRRDQLVRQGRLVPAARGWFATAEADRSALGAIRSGVRLTCVSAARLHGLWTPTAPGTHVYGRRGLVPPSFVPHGPYRDRWPETTPVASLPLCLEHAARCLPAELAATMIESTLTKRLLHPAQVDQLTLQLPARIRARLLPLSGLSESGSETRVARWLRARCVPFAQQVQIDGVGRVDFLVGRSWVIEVDSRAHHTLVADYERDRRRDLAARLRGYTVTRLSFTQVWDSWPATQADLAALVATRRHLRPPRRAN
ncbi:MAG TPA: hypothetical protein VK060_04380 [Ruania sp.]|nr:hypothetical protein [Ruania sp.]